MQELRRIVLTDIANAYSFEQFEEELSNTSDSRVKQLRLILKENSYQKVYFGMIFDIMKDCKVRVKRERYKIVSERMFEEALEKEIGKAIHNNASSPFKLYGYSCNTNNSKIPTNVLCNELREKIRSKIKILLQEKFLYIN